MARKTYHVISNLDGGWSVIGDEATRASRNFKTKRDAVTWGREISKSQRSEFVIHKQDGTIQQIDTYGNNSLPHRVQRCEGLK